MIQQLSLVALYGQKQLPLQLFLEQLNNQIIGYHSEIIFKPYSPLQIHSTIVGMEASFEANRIINHNYFEIKGLKRTMNFKNLFTLVNSELPINFQFGGFEPEYCQFLSKGIHPYNRSIDVDKNGKLIMIGWPKPNENYENKGLLNLRQKLENDCNFYHKYRNDNDFYMVMGKLPPLLNSPELIAELISYLRNYMWYNPFYWELTANNVSVIAYSDPELPYETTQTYTPQIISDTTNMPECLYRFE